MDPEDNGVIPSDEGIAGPEPAAQSGASFNVQEPATAPNEGGDMGSSAAAEGSGAIPSQPNMYPINSPSGASQAGPPAVTATIQDRKTGKTQQVDLTADQFHNVLRGPDMNFDGLMGGGASEKFVQAAQNPGKPVEPATQGQPITQPAAPQPQRPLNPMGNAGQFMGPGYKYDDQGNALIPKGIPLRTLSVPRGSKFLGYRPDGSAVIGPGWNAFPKVQEGDPSKTPAWQAQHRAAIAAEPSTVGGTASGDLKPDQLAPDGKTVISGRNGSTRPYDPDHPQDTRTATDINVVSGFKTPFNPQQQTELERAKIHADAIKTIGQNKIDNSQSNNTRTNAVRALGHAISAAQRDHATKLSNKGAYGGSAEEAEDLENIRELEMQLQGYQQGGNRQPQQSPGIQHPTPSPTDIQYLQAHPEVEANFEARFGPGSVAKYKRR